MVHFCLDRNRKMTREDQIIMLFKFHLVLAREQMTNIQLTALKVFSFGWGMKAVDFQETCKMFRILWLPNISHHLEPYPIHNPRDNCLI